jgi:hypothetical protein
MTETKRPTVTVQCGVPMGLQLSTFDPRDPRTLTLKAGSNPNVDKKFWDDWVAANSQSSVVVNGMVTVLKEEDKDQPDPWTVRGV